MNWTDYEIAAFKLGAASERQKVTDDILDHATAEAKGYKAGLRKAAEMAEGFVDESGAIMDPYELVRRLRALAEKPE